MNEDHSIVFSMSQKTIAPIRSMYTEELYLPNVSDAICIGNWSINALNELNQTIEYVEQGLAILKRYSPEEQRGLFAGGRLLVAAAIISRGSYESIHASGRRWPIRHRMIRYAYTERTGLHRK